MNNDIHNDSDNVGDETPSTIMIPYIPGENKAVDNYVASAIIKPVCRGCGKNLDVWIGVTEQDVPDEKERNRMFIETFCVCAECKSKWIEEKEKERLR